MRGRLRTLLRGVLRLIRLSSLCTVSSTFTPLGASPVAQTAKRLSLPIKHGAPIALGFGQGTVEMPSTLIEDQPHAGHDRGLLTADLTPSASDRDPQELLLGHHGRASFLNASPHLAPAPASRRPHVPAGGRRGPLRDGLRSAGKYRPGNRPNCGRPTILGDERLHPHLPALVRTASIGVAQQSSRA